MAAKKIIIGLTVLSLFLTGSQTFADKRELDLFLGVRGEYNDNIFFTSTNTIDDYITTLSGGLKFLNQTERTDLFLSGIVERLIYKDRGELDDTDQYYKGRFGYKFTPRVGAKVNAAYTMDSRPDREVADTGLLLSTIPRKVQDYGGELNYDLTEITSSNVFYRYTRQDFEPRETISDFSDYRAHRAGLNFAHRLDEYLANTTGRLNFGYNRFEYPLTDTDTNVYIGTVGFSYDLTEKWQLLLDIGPDYYDTEFKSPSGISKNDGWGGTGRLEVKYAGEYVGCSVNVFHGIEPASGRDGSARRTFGKFDIFYRFAERGRTGFETGYYINKANAGELAILPFEERTFRIRPWLRFDILFDKLYLEASYTYTSIDDKIVNRDRDRSLAWLQLGLDWPVIE